MNTNEYLVKKMLNKNIIVTILVTLTATLSTVINSIITGTFLGNDSLTAIGLASPMFILLGAFAGIFSNGGTINCAKYMGMGDEKKVQMNFSMATMAAIVTGIVYGAICLIFAEQLGALFGGGSAIEEQTAQYIRALGFCALPFLLLQNLLLYLRMDNNQKLALVAMIVSIGVNAGLALYSASSTDMGLFGIGMSLTMGSLAGLIVSMFHFTRKERVLRFRVPRSMDGELHGIVMAGLPTAINRGSQTLRNLILNSFLLTFGTTAVLALSVQTSVYQFLIAISSGYGIMVAMMTGLFVGEKDKGAIESALRVSLKSGVIMSLAAGAILFIFAEPIASLFIQEGGDLALATECLRLFAFSQPTSTVALIFLYMYQAMGDLTLSNIISVARGVVYGVLISLIFAPIFGLNAVWLSFLFADILSILTVIIVIRIRTGKFPRKLEDFVISPKVRFDSEEICSVSVKNDIDDIMGLSDRIDSLFAEKGVDSDKAHRISLCIEEMAGNIVDHGYRDNKGHYIDIRIIRSGDDIIMRIRDDGTAFNPMNAETEEHLGIKTVRAAAKSIQYRYSVGLNNLTVTV